MAGARRRVLSLHLVFCGYICFVCFIRCEYEANVRREYKLRSLLLSPLTSLLVPRVICVGKNRVSFYRSGNRTSADILDVLHYCVVVKNAFCITELR